jgi:predicted component of type VI protein secretion system
MGLRLIIEDVEGATTIVPLGEQEVTIGREGGNTIQLTEQNVSRAHARIVHQDDRWKIVDLDSYNGVLVNGQPIAGQADLHEGDLIQIGDYHLVLADETERRTVDMDGPVRAANDDEPLLASSSADLPKLSDAELAALRSGSREIEDVGEPEPAPRRGGGAGLKLVGVAALLGVAGGIAWLVLGRPSAAPEAAVAVRAEPPRAEPTPAPLPPPVPTPTEPQPVEAVDPAADAGEGGVADGTDGDAVPDETDGGAAADEETGEPEGRGPGPRPVAKKKKSTPEATAKEPDDGGVPPPPVGPAQTPEQLLADARKASLAGDAARAYALARDSHKLSQSEEALQLMGVSACKMGDATKARAAHKKLTGGKRTQLASLCASKGIEL